MMPPMNPPVITVTVTTRPPTLVTAVLLSIPIGILAVTRKAPPINAEKAPKAAPPRGIPTSSNFVKRALPIASSKRAVIHPVIAP